MLSRIFNAVDCADLQSAGKTVLHVSFYNYAYEGEVFYISCISFRPTCIYVLNKSINSTDEYFYQPTELANAIASMRPRPWFGRTDVLVAAGVAIDNDWLDFTDKYMRAFADILWINYRVGVTIIHTMFARASLQDLLPAVVRWLILSAVTN